MHFVRNSLAYSGRLHYPLGIKKPSRIDALIQCDEFHEILKRVRQREEAHLSGEAVSRAYMMQCCIKYVTN